MKDLVEKLGFEIVYKSDDYDKIEIDINEVNRPGLQLSGFFDTFSYYPSLLKNSKIFLAVFLSILSTIRSSSTLAFFIEEMLPKWDNSLIFLISPTPFISSRTEFCNFLFCKLLR